MDLPLGPTLIVLLVSLYVCTVDSDNGQRPNVVIMLADDLGYGDVGCFGNKTIRTPNIDKLAEEGIKLTHHLAAASVCSPSRAALLTGRLPIRSGMAPDGLIPVNPYVANKGGLPQSEVTIAEIVKSAGYKTALIGKWHLGLSRDSHNDHAFHPLNQGFDYYYGHILSNVKDFGGEGDATLLFLMPYLYHQMALGYILGIVTFFILLRKGYINKLTFMLMFAIITVPVIYIVFIIENFTILNSILMRDFDVVEQPIQLITLMKRYVNEGIEYMEQRKNDGSQFLLVLSWDRVHTALKIPKEFRGKSKHGRYGDAVEELDWGTGEIMSAIKRFGFDKNTLVYFSSDNGAHLEERGINGEIDGGSNGIFKGGKSHGAVDGGIRVPSVFWFPGRLPRNKVIDEPTSQMDLLPSIAHLSNVQVPSDKVIDGRNILPLLEGKESISPHEFFFHYCGNTVHAVRYRPRKGTKIWKLVLYEPNYLPGKRMCPFACLCRQAKELEPPVLYELSSDPGENKPLNISLPNIGHKEISELMLKALQEHHSSVEPVERQVTFYKTLWWPNLQPCCNFPYCNCKDEKYSHLL